MISRNLEKTLWRTLTYAKKWHHEYATLGHLFLALTEDQDAVAVLRARTVDLQKLRDDIIAHVDIELRHLVSNNVGDVNPTASFNRVLQRAASHVQMTGDPVSGYRFSGETTGADVLFEMFAEPEVMDFLRKHQHRLDE